MNNRIQQFIDAERLTPAKLADTLGVQRSNISHILSGRNKPGFDFIEKILKKFPVLNPDWLLLGKGSMYREAYSPTLFPTNEDIEKTETIAHKGLSPEPEKWQLEEEVKNIPPINNLNKRKKEVDRVMFFYTDGTFDTYTPSEK